VPILYPYKRYIDFSYMFKTQSMRHFYLHMYACTLMKSADNG